MYPNKNINICLFISEYWLILNDVPGTVLGSGNKAVNKAEQGPSSHAAYILMGEADNKSANNRTDKICKLCEAGSLSVCTLV